LKRSSPPELTHR